MTKNKLTQKEAIFYTLYKTHKTNPEFFTPVFKFMGEVHCTELDLWGFVSHECSARCSEMKKENPDLIQHTEITGKSGAKYFGYRLNTKPTIAMILDPKLLAFFKSIRA